MSTDKLKLFCTGYLRIHFNKYNINSNTNDISIILFKLLVNYSYFITFHKQIDKSSILRIHYNFNTILFPINNQKLLQNINIKNDNDSISLISLRLIKNDCNERNYKKKGYKIRFGICGIAKEYKNTFENDFKNVNNSSFSLTQFNFGIV